MSCNVSNIWLIPAWILSLSGMFRTSPVVSRNPSIDFCIGEDAVVVTTVVVVVDIDNEIDALASKVCMVEVVVSLTILLLGLSLIHI